MCFKFPDFFFLDLLMKCWIQISKFLQNNELQCLSHYWAEKKKEKKKRRKKEKKREMKKV